LGFRPTPSRQSFRRCCRVADNPGAPTPQILCAFLSQRHFTATFATHSVQQPTCSQSRESLRRRPVVSPSMMLACPIKSADKAVPVVARSSTAATMGRHANFIPAVLLRADEKTTPKTAFSQRRSNCALAIPADRLTSAKCAHRHLYTALVRHVKIKKPLQN
jgi:hypothetical protein